MSSLGNRLHMPLWEVPPEGFDENENYQFRLLLNLSQGLPISNTSETMTLLSSCYLLVS